MTTTSLVQKRVMKTPLGQPFTTNALLGYGSRAAVDQALSRMASAGKVIRITRGVYVRPEENRFIGQILPEPFKVAAVIAKKTKETIQVSGAEAARQFGLSTQVSVKPVFLTTGQSRRFKIGSLEVTLRRVSRKKIPFTESKVGLAILAMWYLGKNSVTTQTIEQIERKLSVNEFKKFTSSREYMPAWMSDVVLHYQSNRGE